MANAELEIVTYRTEEMMRASKQLVRNYAQHSGLPGTELWPRTIAMIVDIIRNQSPRTCSWTTPGLSMEFSGFPTPRERVNEEGEIKLVADEPMFTLDEGWPYYIKPILRTQINRVTGAIVEEMHDVYKLEVSNNGNFHYLKFPKGQYAKNIDIVTVPLLATG
jgi:hypothetical protein